MARDRVLILTASAGAGHVMAARALVSAFQAAAPGVDVELLDVLAISSPVFRRMYAGGYLSLVRHLPAGMGWLYDATDRPRRPGLAERLRVTVQNLNKLPATRFIDQHRPRLIVSTHFLPAEWVAQMRRAGRLAVPQTVVTTDYETHRMWMQEPCERYYTASDCGAVYLTTCGVAPERTRVTGIPVRPGFEPAMSPGEARRACGLNPDRPAVLLLSGGFGVGPTAELMEELLHLDRDVQLVANTGRNEKLRARLQRLADRHRRVVHVVGYTDRLFEWMRAADLVVSKPGGLTVSECLAVGVPLVIVNPIPGQETRNSDYVLEHGAGVKVNRPSLLRYRVAGLLSDPPRLQALRRSAESLGRPGAAAEIARDALALASLTAG